VYDRLFSDEDPDGHKDKDFKEFLNPDSLKALKNCKLEPALKTAKPGDKFQFQRLGYFCVDPDTTDIRPIFNRTVPLRDSWSKKKNK
jgi:glutaminyl-tRNA synthetase